MNSRAIMGISIGAVLAISMTVAAYAVHASWQTVNPDVVTPGPVVTNFLVNSTAAIPAHTKDLAGFAWLYGVGPNTVFAITTHHSVKDSVQRPYQWHTHNIILGAGAGASEFCVIDIVDAPFAKINVKQNIMDVTVQTASLTGPIIPGVIPFDITVQAGCPVTMIGGAPNPFGLTLGVNAVAP